MNTLRGADFNAAYINIIGNKNHFHSPKLEKNQKKPIPPPRLLLSTLQRAVKKQQFRAKPLPSPFCRARLARFTTCRTLKSPSLSKYRTFSPVEQGEFSPSLSGSKLFTTAAVYARLDIYLQRERNGAAVSETASSQVEIKRRSETNFILRTEERSVQVLVTPASWETRLLFPFFLSHIFLLPWKTASRALTRCSSIVEHELV